MFKFFSTRSAWSEVALSDGGWPQAPDGRASGAIIATACNDAAHNPAKSNDREIPDRVIRRLDQPSRRRETQRSLPVYFTAAVVLIAKT